MQTRTELIHLQRTMVVVEGVSRSLNPQINIWEVARPVVESYIAEAMGPKAIVKDLAHAARILARFGPRLPQIAEAALIRQSRVPPDSSRHRPLRALSYFAFGSVVTLGAVFLLSLL